MAVNCVYFFIVNNIYCLLPLTVLAYPVFYIRIPNGDQVPHVCPPASSDPATQRWPGVGHWNPRGGDGTKNSLNPFGRDFAANDFRWTVSLCRNDSDSDGKSNGEELGDPDCQWSQHSHTPPSGNATSHPGICEPIGSPDCAAVNTPLAPVCPYHIDPTSIPKEQPATKAKACPSLTSDSVETFDLRLTGGPAEISVLEEALTETDEVHFCQTFTLPSDKAYHMIAMMPTTGSDDNFFITHITLHACVDYADELNLAVVGGLNKPNRKACRLLWPCSKLLGSWSFDPTAKVPITCFSPLYGIRFGFERFDKVVVDYYYAFRTEKINSSVVDVSDSGVTLFYQSKLRRFDLGVLLMGENFIKLPPDNRNYTITANLPNKCLSKLATEHSSVTPVYASLHANGFFTSLQLSFLPLNQPKKYSKTLAYVDKADSLKQPFYTNRIGNTVIRSVDSLSFKCIYDTGDHSQFVFYGSPPEGEMCFSAIAFYPADNTTWFIDGSQIGSFTACDALEKDKIVNGCPYESFALKYQSVISGLRETCASSLYPPLVCPTECKTLIVRENLLGHDCLKGDIFQKIARSPYLITTGMPLTPVEASSVAATIDLCRHEIYSIVIEKSGLQNRLNKSIESEYALRRVLPCLATSHLLAGYHRQLIYYCLSSVSLAFMLNYSEIISFFPTLLLLFPSPPLSQ